MLQIVDVLMLLPLLVAVAIPARMSKKRVIAFQELDIADDRMKLSGAKSAYKVKGSKLMVVAKIKVG